MAETPDGSSSSSAGAATSSASPGPSPAAGPRWGLVLGVIVVVAIIVVGLGFANVIPGFHLSPASTPGGSTSSKTYTVRVTETGLPSGTTWTVTLGGKSASGTGTTLSFIEAAGTFSYSVAAVTGYTVAPASGTVTVAQSNVTLSVTFTPVSKGSGAPPSYGVSFQETGLPASTSWSVTFNGSMASSSGTSIAFRAPNGTYDYSVGAVPGYRAAPSSSSATVDGAAISVPIAFTAIPPAVYSVTFTESGLPAGTNWTVTLAGTSSSTTGSSIEFSETNGSYYYSIGALPVYLSDPGSGTVRVDGSAQSVPIAWSHVAPPASDYYNATFAQTGLANNITWGWQGALSPSTFPLYPLFAGTGDGSTIVLSVPNGTYYWAVGSVYAANGTEYSASPATGNFTVAGSAVSIPVHFAVNSSGTGGTNGTGTNYTVTVNEVGLPPGGFWFAGAGGAYGFASVGSPVTFGVPNGTYALEAFSSAGYSLKSAPSFTVAGAAVSLTVTFIISYLVGFSAPTASNTTYWEVDLNGSTEATDGQGPIGFEVPNGTYPYTVTSAGHTASPSRGNVTVAGSDVNVTLSFSTFPTDLVTFSEKGLPTGTNWTAELFEPGAAGNGSIGNTTNTSSLAIATVPGNYSWLAATTANTWYWATPTTGAFDLDAAGVSINLTFTYRANVTPIVFEEAADYYAGVDGAPNGTTWGIDLGGTTLSTTGMLLVFLVPNGTYSFLVSAPSGYWSLPGGGSFTVFENFLAQGAAIDVYVAFLPGTAPVAPPTEAPLSALPVDPFSGAAPAVAPSRTLARSFGLP